ELGSELNRCVKCGTCRSICPTFRVIGRESAAARGKLALIRAYLDGDKGLGEDYVRHLKECTMCGGCRDSCPSGVDTVRVMNAARAEHVEKEGVSFAASFMMRNLLDYKGIMPKALRYVSKFRGILFKDSPTENGLVSRFSLPVIGCGRLVPELAGTFFLDTAEARALGAGPLAEEARVAFYSGCGVNFLMPEVGLKSVKALGSTGPVVVPGEQVCCGMPAYYSGDVETAKKLAIKNIKVFEEYDLDYIITSCATCSHALKNVFKDIISETGDEALMERAERFAEKVRDITEFLPVKQEARLAVEDEAVQEQGGKKPVVTYHDPCHLNRNQGIRDAPRDLIKSQKNLEFREMRFPCSCCGLGGGLTMNNYELSVKITKRKAESIEGSGADIVATACPGCIVQLRDGLHKYGVKAKVVHVVDLL
ncbi:MAG: (Fe-S)-binding protein, partial [Thermodesulfobacteriota bacterium]